MAVLADLSEVREFYNSSMVAQRAAEIDLMRIYSDACVIFLTVLRGVPADEMEILADMSADFRANFERHPGKKASDYSGSLLQLQGVDKDRLDKAAYLRLTVVEATWLEPAALLQHFRRLRALPTG